MFVLVFGLVLSVLFFGYSLFSVKSFKVLGAEGNSIMGLDGYKGTNIFFVSEKSVSEEIKSKNPRVKKVNIGKLYPSVLTVTLFYYSQVAELNAGNGYFILSDDGRILAKNKSKSNVLPEINFYQKLNYHTHNAGDYIGTSDILDSIYYIKFLGNLGLNVDYLDIKDRDMLLCNIGEKSIVFTTAKSREKQIYELTQIIRQFKIAGTEYKSIDLRFEKPIVKF